MKFPRPSPFFSLFFLSSFFLLNAFARADYLDSTGIPNFVDDRLNTNWYCIFATSKGVSCNMEWRIQYSYDLRLICGEDREVQTGEMGNMRANGGRWASLSDKGRMDGGYYQILPAQHWTDAQTGRRDGGWVMYVWNAKGVASIWTTYNRSLSNKSITPPPAKPPNLTLAPPDKAVVSAWKGYFYTPTGGKFITTLSIKSDGHYVWDFVGANGTKTQTGIFETDHGRFITHPDGDNVDHGTYGVEKDMATQTRVMSLKSNIFGAVVMREKR